MTRAGREPRLVHITTVPMTLHFLKGQPRYMAQRLGLVTHAISSAGPDFQAFLEREPDVVAHEVEMDRRITPFRDAKALLALVRLLRRLAPAVVHTHTPKAGLLGVLAARAAGVPLVVHHIHGGVWQAASGLRRSIARWTDRLTCSLAHRVLCVSESVRAALVRERLCAARRVEVLGHGSINGIDARAEFDPDRFTAEERAAIRERLGIPAEAIVLGFVGRLTVEKGIRELYAAWRRLSADHPDLRMLLVGEPDSATPLAESLLHELAEDPRIHMTGMTWHTLPLFAAMDVFVLPTYREGFPVALLEAAAMRLPVVATRVPGCTDAVVDGQTGMLVQPRSAEALEGALRALIPDRARISSLGSAGRERVLRDFRPEVLWEALASRYAVAGGIRVPVRPHIAAGVDANV
jgi:glycosyltransferase involved in cell wall biosynthesis